MPKLDGGSSPQDEFNLEPGKKAEQAFDAALSDVHFERYQDPVLSQAIEAANDANHDATDARIQAAAASQSTPELIEALQNPRQDVRVQAAAILGARGATEAIPSLCHDVQENNPGCVISIQALGKIGGDEALATLRQAVERHPGYAAQAIAAIGTPDAKRLLTTLAFSEDARLREKVFTAAQHHQQDWRDQDLGSTAVALDEMIRAFDYYGDADKVNLLTASLAVTRTYQHQQSERDTSPLPEGAVPLSQSRPLFRQLQRESWQQLIDDPFLGPLARQALGLDLHTKDDD